LQAERLPGLYPDRQFAPIQSIAVLKAERRRLNFADMVPARNLPGYRIVRLLPRSKDGTDWRGDV
jgi:hypothetical protein